MRVDVAVVGPGAGRAEMDAADVAKSLRQLATAIEAHGLQAVDIACDSTEDFRQIATLRVA